MARKVVGISLRKALLLGASVFTLAATGPGTRPVMAQELEGAIDDLGTIVITASRTEQSLMDVTRSVATVEQEEIAEKTVSDVAELLSDIPGVSIVESASPGLRRISIRGEGDTRNVVLVDGQEITDHSTYGPPFLIDPAMIERVEVVKGPSSVLHGARAIGGVVNIITKKGGNKPMQVSVGVGYDSSTRGYNSNASVFGSQGNWGYRFTATRSEHGDRETPDGKLVETTKSFGSSFDNMGFAGNIGYSHENHAFRIAVEKFDLSSDVHSEPTDDKFRAKLPKRDRTKAAFFYDGEDLTEQVKKVHLDAYYQHIERQFDVEYELGLPVFRGGPGPAGMTTTNSTNQSKDDQKTYGVNGQIDLELLDNHLTIAGFQVVHETIEREDKRRGTATTVMFGPPGAPAITPINDNLSKEASLSTYSAFLQDEWSIWEDLTLTAGTRLSHIEAKLSKTNQSGQAPNNNKDTAIIGALGLNYTGFDNLSLRANVAQGYVYPTLVQTALGSVVSPAGLIDPNANLKPEESINFEVGARFDNGVALLDLAAFYSTAENYIDTMLCTTCAAGTGAQFRFENVDKAVTTGLEVSASYAFEDWGLTPYVDATVMRREFNDNGNKYDETDTPSLQGRLGVRKDWAFSDRLTGMTDIYMRGATVRKQYDSRKRVTKSLPSFATLNIGSSLAYEFADDRTFRLNASVENILDHSYIPSHDDGMRAAGRTFKISSQLTF